MVNDKSENNMQRIKDSLTYIIFFTLAVLTLTGLLVLAAQIPRSAISENMQKSAEYLCEGELFDKLAENVDGSKIDRYADSILLAIAWQYDEEEPLSSVVRSAYYYTPWQNENENLLDAVTQGYEANQEYLRYWHGANTLVRPLLVFFTLPQIYVINGIMLVILILVLLILLIKQKAFAPALGMAAGLLAVSAWYVPFSLEYTWTFLLMLVLSILAWKLAGIKGNPSAMENKQLVMGSKNRTLGIFFLLAGILTSFLDFLTTETLTLLVPLLLVLWKDQRKNPQKAWKRRFLDAGRAAVFWGMGYAGMWVMKWLLAAAVLKENVLPYITGHVEERLGVTVGGWWNYIPKVIARNVGCLFPFDYGGLGAAVGFMLVLLAGYIGYVYHKKNICKESILLYALLGVVPYFRYCVLLNHSYLHFFFTYRAQMTTILAAVLVLEELTDGRCFFSWNCLKKKVLHYLS